MPTPSTPDPAAPSDWIETALSAGEALAAPHLVRPDDDAFLAPLGFVVHKDMVFKEFDPKEFRSAPFRATGDRHAYSVADFVAMVDRYMQRKDTISVTAAMKAHAITAILNDSNATNGDPGWGDHRVIFTCKASDELAAWRKCFDWQNQAAFAEHLEERHDEVEEGAALLEIANELTLTRDAACRSAIRLQTGSTRLDFRDETTAGSIDVPATITLLIPLFAGGPVFRLPAFLRYRLREQSVQFLVKPKLLVRAEEQAFQELVDAVQEGLAAMPNLATVKVLRAP